MAVKPRAKMPPRATGRGLGQAMTGVQRPGYQQPVGDFGPGGNVIMNRPPDGLPYYPTPPPDKLPYFPTPPPDSPTYQRTPLTGGLPFERAFTPGYNPQLGDWGPGGNVIMDPPPIGITPPNPNLPPRGTGGLPYQRPPLTGGLPVEPKMGPIGIDPRESNGQMPMTPRTPTPQVRAGYQPPKGDFGPGGNLAPSPVAPPRVGGIQPVRPTPAPGTNALTMRQPGYRAASRAPLGQAMAAKPPLRGFAMGGRPRQGETVMVGEQGPEAVTLPKGGMVIPNHQLTAHVMQATPTAKPTNSYATTGPRSGNTGITGGMAGPIVGPMTAAPSSGGVGHDGTYKGLNREAYRDKWMSSGATSLADLQKFISQYGGTLDSGNGTVITPYGEKIDMGIGARKGAGQMKAGWGAVGADAVAKAQAQGGMAGGTQGPGQMTASPTGGMTGAPNNVTMPGNFTYQPMQNLTAYQPGSPFSYGSTPQAQAIHAGQIDPAQVQGPATLTGQQIQSPEALEAERFKLGAGFQAPTAEDLYNDPSYQFRLNEGQKRLEASKAMQGVLRTGGVAQQLQDYGQQAASQEYANVYGRKMGEYQTDVQNRLAANQTNNASSAQAYGLTNQYQQNAALANQQNAFNVGQANIQNQQQSGQFNAGLQQQANMANVANNLGADQFNSQQQMQAQQLGYQQAAGTYGMNADNDYRAQAFNSQQALAQNAQQYAQAQGAWQGNVNAALGQGQLNLGYQQANQNYQLGQGQLNLGQGNLALQQGAQNWMQNTQFPWQQQYQIAGMGLTAAQLQAQNMAQYGQNGQNAYYGQGNAQAAGEVGAGNAWNQAYQNVGNTAQDAYALWYAQHQGNPGGGA